MVQAFVVPKPGQEITGPEIRKFCLQSLGRFEVPRKVIILAALPKNATGKILKRELRKAGEVERGVVFEADDED
jgi:long-chain acyl-CoA synthetase